MNMVCWLGWVVLVLGCVVCLWGFLGVDVIFIVVVVVVGMCVVVGGLGVFFVFFCLVWIYCFVGWVFVVY